MIKRAEYNRQLQELAIEAEKIDAISTLENQTAMFLCKRMEELSKISDTQNLTFDENETLIKEMKSLLLKFEYEQKKMDEGDRLLENLMKRVAALRELEINNQIED